jgi:phage baseplate assembly protein gpV
MILVPPYTKGNRPPEGKKGIWRKDFGDGSYIRYDKESKQLDIVSDSVHMEGLSVSGNLSVSGSINAGSITTGGNVHIKGNLTVDGSYPK